MGHEHQQSSSSGTVVAIVVGVLLVGFVGLLAVAGASLLWLGTSRTESRIVAVAEANRAVAEELRAKGEAMHAASQLQRATHQIQRSSIAATPDSKLNIKVTIDREGIASIDGGGIDLDELRARLGKLKDETGNAISVLIDADPECPVKLLIPVLDVCTEVGDIDFSIEVASSGVSESSSE